MKAIVNTKIRTIIFICVSLMLLSNCRKDNNTTGIQNTIIDIDSNVYKTIIIGTQLWMAEDLKTTKYNDGTPIPNVTDNAAWSKLTIGAYCWYNNDTSNKTTYGALYNWYAINTGKLCPKGWHVPTVLEWNTLINYLGSDSVAGGKLKEIDTLHWLSPNLGATNRTGFTALPGGCRNYKGEFVTIGLYACLWSSIEKDNLNAFYKIILFYNSAIENYSYNKTCGFSVRCIKDK
jgi:uncharacterized protein (TIGR02145 family)